MFQQMLRGVQGTRKGKNVHPMDPRGPPALLTEMPPPSPRMEPGHPPEPTLVPQPRLILFPHQVGPRSQLKSLRGGDGFLQD